MATGREGDLRTLVVVDDGIGVPTHLQDRIFEPRVTSKLDTMVTDTWGVHGRGMALFSVRSNAEYGPGGGLRRSQGPGIAHRRGYDVLGRAGRPVVVADRRARRRR